MKKIDPKIVNEILRKRLLSKNSSRKHENMAGEKEKHQFEELSNKIIGAAIEVHRMLGPGFLESIYEQALRIQFSELKLHCDSQKEIKIKYHGIEVGQHRLDMTGVTGLKVGLLLNFGKPTLEIKRVVN